MRNILCEINDSETIRSMAIIPGLSLIPVDENEGGIILTSFDGSTVIPESHRYGNSPRISEFSLLGTIHEGSFGIIYKCQNTKTRDIFALKKFKMTSADMYQGVSIKIVREIKFLSILKHVNIANSHRTVAGDNIANNYLLMDYCATSLDELISKKVMEIFEKPTVKCIMKQLFEGLDFMHKSMIIHRNINCRNVLFTETGRLKISGFQTAELYSIDMIHKIPEVYDPLYTAPEILLETLLYATPVDIWSAGCIFARLLLKRHLFTGSDATDVLLSIFDTLGTPSDTIWPKFTRVCMDVGRRLIQSGQPNSDLLTNFTGQCLSSTELIKGLLVYYPPARQLASEALDTIYFNDAVQSSTHEDLALIVQNFLKSAAPMDIEQ